MCQTNMLNIFANYSDKYNIFIKATWIPSHALKPLIAYSIGLIRTQSIVFIVC